MTEELFKNSHDALVFAFRFSSQQYALSPMAKMMKTGIVGTGKGLVSIDGAGQVGMIRSQIEKIPPVHRACIVARYSLRFETCACCGNDGKMLQEYREAISTLGQWATSTFSGLSTRVAREMVIRSYYERGMSIKAIAEKTQISKSTLHDYKSKIMEKLKDTDHLAQIQIGELLEKIFELA